LRPLPGIESIDMFKNSEQYFQINKKGFLTVEAAIFLPIFIIGVLTFAYLIKFMAVQEAVFHSFTDEAKVLSSEASMNPVAAPLFELNLKDRVYDENGNNISSVDIDHFLYLYHTHGMSAMISMDLNYAVNIKLPIPFYRELPVSESLLFRGFVGREEIAAPLPYEEMETVKKSNLVWIFPRAGGKNHSENCTYLKTEPKQMIMSQMIRRIYEPCSICDSHDLSNGNLVYCFKTGQAYHTGSCPIVDKYVVSIEKEAAIKRGYTVCMKCGGE